MWQQSGQGCDISLVLKARPFVTKKLFSLFDVGELDWPAQSLNSTPFNTFGMNRNTDCQLGLITQHQCLTSLMLLSLNESKSCCQIPVFSGKPSRKSGGCYNSRLMPMVWSWNAKSNNHTWM